MTKDIRRINEETGSQKKLLDNNGFLDVTQLLEVAATLEVSVKVVLGREQAVALLAGGNRKKVEVALDSLLMGLSVDVTDPLRLLHELLARKTPLDGLVLLVATRVLGDARVVNAVDVSLKRGVDVGDSRRGRGAGLGRLRGRGAGLGLLTLLHRLVGGRLDVVRELARA